MSRRLKHRSQSSHGHAPAPVDSAIQAAVVEALEERKLLSTVKFASPPTVIATNNAAPYSVAIGDVNGDGIPDMVVACSNGTVEVFLGEGNGTFQGSRRYSDGLSASNSAFVVLAKLDPGAYSNSEDIVVGSTGDAEVSVLLGTGKGTFKAAQTFTVTSGSYVYSVAVADINGDEDIVTGNTNGTVSVLYGYNNGTFESTYTTVTPPGGPGNVRVAAGTLATANGSKVLLATTNSVTNDVIAVTPNGKGKFTYSGAYSVGSQPDSIALGSFTSDTDTDILVGADDGTVSVLLGNGNGSFNQPNTMSVGQNVDTVAIADINGDGDPDIVMGGQFFGANSSSAYGAARVLFGNGNGSFQTNAPYTVKTYNTYPRVVAGALVTGDSRNDLVITNYVSKSLSVLLNSTVSGTGPNGAASITLADGVLTIDGTPENDTAELSVSPNGKRLLIELNSVGYTETLASVTAIDMHMGAGNDSVSIAAGVGAVSVDGGHGDDTIVASNRAPDTLFANGKDSIHGGGGPELLEAAGNGSTLIGGHAHDTLIGMSGGDSITADGRVDSVLGKGGSDTLAAGPGEDTLRANGGKGSVSGGSGPDLLYGGGGHDTLTAGATSLIGVEVFLGGNTLKASGGDNLLIGFNGQNDLIESGTGSDTLVGDLSATGMDTLIATAAGDSIQGGARDSIVSVAFDTVTGGA
ncbi:MAG: VCBS repeat-containing protein, partial [Tepidisphaeraceae bacterium]